MRPSPLIQSLVRNCTSSTSTTPRALLLSCSCSKSTAQWISSSSSRSGNAFRSLSTTAARPVFSFLPKHPRSTSSTTLGYFTSSFPPLPFFSSHRFASTLSAPQSPSSTSETFADPQEAELPILTNPQVATYLFIIAGMVFAIVVVGGMTRLTESGLSITEWNVVSGVLPPIGQKDWEMEFEKYKATPEWRIQNQHISLEEFKRIYFWEWSHRILGRLIGVAFILPIPYFYLRRRLSPRATLSLLSIGTLIGGQGALGWYMVKSGLDEVSVKELGGVPRVSQYRLAAHLGMAFAVYAGCLRLALGVGRDWKLVKNGGQGLAGLKSVEETLRILNGKTAGNVRNLVTALTALVFVTAISGAFVAGLDAGLVYNEFPLMGGRLIPPAGELMSDFYARTQEKTDKWRNFFENPTTVQFDHRVLATTTFASIVGLFLFVRRPHIRSHLPPTTFRLLKGTMHMATLQVALGISTLIYLVPIHLAATHQAGSLVLLSLALATGASLRRPGKVASEIMKLRKVGSVGK